MSSSRFRVLSLLCQNLLTESFRAHCSAIIISQQANFQRVENSRLINEMMLLKQIVVHALIAIHLKPFDAELQTTLFHLLTISVIL